MINRTGISKLLERKGISSPLLRSLLNNTTRNLEGTPIRSTKRKLITMTMKRSCRISINPRILRTSHIIIDKRKKKKKRMMVEEVMRNRRLKKARRIITDRNISIRISTKSLRLRTEKNHRNKVSMQILEKQKKRKNDL